MNTLKYVLLGSGGIANAHVNALSKLANVQFVGAQDVSAAALDNWKKQHPQIEIDSDPVKLLKRTRPDLACVCAPNVAHLPLVKAAFEAGCHVICEKPMAMNLAEAREMERLRQAAGKLGAINFSYRCVPTYRLAAELVKRGELGHLHRLNVVYLQSFLSDSQMPYSWRNDVTIAGFGTMGDLGVHMIDAARFVSGLNPRRVVGLARTLVPSKKDAEGKDRPITTDTNASFLIEFDGGVIGTFETSQTTPGYGNHFELEISGDGGLARVGSEDGEGLTLLSGAVTQWNTWTRPPLPRVAVPTGFASRQPTSNHQGLVAAIRGEKMDYPTFADGIASQAVLEALLESMKTRAWVELASIG